MVKSFMELLQRRAGPALDDDCREYVVMALDGARRMSQLLHGLLEYSRVGTHGQQSQNVDVRQTVQGALANLQAAIEDAKAQISVGDLPLLTADATQLTQLFQNLIGNALKFRRAGIAPKIHVGSRRQDDQWLFWISDDGIGFDSAHLDRIFQIFQRLHTRGEYPGTGVGLAVCRKIVERHGGTIWAKSQAGSGSTFYFTLPGPGP